MVAGNIFYVPWPDFSEWNTVREQIFSSDIQDTIAAYRTVAMWKLKYHSIPAYIECTYGLLQVMVKEYEMTKTEQNSLLFNEHELQMSYSTALIRFVNHVSSVSTYKGGSLYYAAKSQNIPDWLINMRHDVAHGQNLPALDALHVAAELSLKWLLDYYWGNPEACQEKEVDVTHVDLESGWQRDVCDVGVQDFFKKFFNIWKQMESKTDDVVEYNREFILHLEELLSLNMVYFSNTKNDCTEGLQSIVNAYNQMEESGEIIESSLDVKSFMKLLFKFMKNVIKGDDQLKHTFVLSLFETTFLSENNLRPQKWQEIFHLMQETFSFSFFFETLFQLAGKGYKGACEWLSVLLPSIKHLKRQWGVYRILLKERKHYQMNLVKSKIQSTPPDLDVVVNLAIFKPPTISLEMIKSVLLNPEPLPVENLVGYLELVRPPLVKSTLDMITDLVSLHMTGNSMEELEEAIDDKVFTVEDLDKVMESEESAPEEKATDGDGWTRSSIDVEAWNKCPLGLLPFQTKVDCSLPDSILWERKRASRKRGSLPLQRHSDSMKKLKQF